MNKIKTVSHLFRILFQLAFITEIILLVWFWLNGAHPLAIGSITNPMSTHAHTGIGTGAAISFIPDYLNISIQYPLNTQTKLLGFLASCIPTGITLGIFYCLIKLFRLYEHAEIFTQLNVKYFKKIGYLLLASALTKPLYEALISAALTFHNPPGHGLRNASATFGSDNLTLIIISLIVILIAWVMTEGCKLRDEQAYTV